MGTSSCTAAASSWVVGTNSAFGRNRRVYGDIDGAELHFDRVDQAGEPFKMGQVGRKAATSSPSSLSLLVSS